MTATEDRRVSPDMWRRLREPTFRERLRLTFDRVLIRACVIWGSDYVIARVQHAIAKTNT